MGQSLKSVRACRARYAAEAHKHGLQNGDTHPDTGRIYYSGRFRTPQMYHRQRITEALKNARTRAQDKQLPYNLTVEWYMSAWPPNGRCEVLPYVVMEWGATDRGTSPSIDRIVPELGYVTTNCRIISNRANVLKNNATEKEMALVLADLRKYGSAH